MELVPLSLYNIIEKGGGVIYEALRIQLSLSNQMLFRL